MIVKTRTAKVLLALLLMLAVSVAFDGVRLARIRALNLAIEDGTVASLAGEPASRATFARAYHLARKGDHQAALDLYKQVESEGGRALRQAARYNSANIYLRQALLARESGVPEQMLPLSELAKEAYRDVLREDSGEWDAKYNLERALRLVPDPEGIADGPPPPNSERAVTTINATNLGLP